MTYRTNVELTNYLCRTINNSGGVRSEDPFPFGDLPSGMDGPVHRVEAPQQFLPRRLRRSDTSRFRNANRV